MALVFTGCVTQSPPAKPAEIDVVPTPTTAASFDAPRGNFSTTLPADWKKIDKGGDYVLALVPSNSGSGSAATILAIQYPTLPPHIPGMLPIGAVADGYVKDLKKRFPDQAVDERSDGKLDGAPARHVISRYSDAGKSFRELAMLAVHGDHVYVITATCPADGFDASRKAFDELTSAWKWK